MAEQDIRQCSCANSSDDADRRRCCGGEDDRAELARASDSDADCGGDRATGSGDPCPCDGVGRDQPWLGLFAGAPPLQGESKENRRAQDDVPEKRVRLTVDLTREQHRS
jgi:hypothetical protein